MQPKSIQLQRDDEKELHQELHDSVSHSWDQLGVLWPLGNGGKRWNRLNLLENVIHLKFPGGGFSRMCLFFNHKTKPRDEPGPSGGPQLPSANFTHSHGKSSISIDKSEITFRGPFFKLSPIGSMYGRLMLTWLGYIDGKWLTIHGYIWHTATDPSWVREYPNSPKILRWLLTF